jgi:hypothetical protein
MERIRYPLHKNICPDIFPFSQSKSSLRFMKKCFSVIFYLPVAMALLPAFPSHAQQVEKATEAAIYTNEEQVYFDKEAGRITLWIGAIPVPVDGQQGKYTLNIVDEFGQKLWNPLRFTDSKNQLGPLHDGKEFTIIVDGGEIRLRRARPVTCWAAIPKKKSKADGSPDWYFIRDIKLHDQGGRARIGGGDSGAPELVIRMRNVIWPANKDGTPSSNRPSLVLYVHKPDKPDSAESYVWADPGAARIGINLRWMQASCTIDGADAPSAVTPTTFRG